eukprot:3464988-Pleurochrysis_carterae.AAC.1
MYGRNLQLTSEGERCLRVCLRKRTHRREQPRRRTSAHARARPDLVRHASALRRRSSGVRASSPGMSALARSSSSRRSTSCSPSAFGAERLRRGARERELKGEEGEAGGTGCSSGQGGRGAGCSGCLEWGSLGKGREGCRHEGTGRGGGRRRKKGGAVCEERKTRRQGAPSGESLAHAHCLGRAAAPQSLPPPLSLSPCVHGFVPPSSPVVLTLSFFSSACLPVSLSVCQPVGLSACLRLDLHSYFEIEIYGHFLLCPACASCRNVGVAASAFDCAVPLSPSFSLAPSRFAPLFLRPGLCLISSYSRARVRACACTTVYACSNARVAVHVSQRACACARVRVRVRVRVRERVRVRVRVRARVRVCVPLRMHARSERTQVHSLDAAHASAKTHRRFSSSGEMANGTVDACTHAR